MNEADIRKYAEMMQELGLTGLEITEDNKKVRLERMAAPAQTAVINAAPAAPASSGILDMLETLAVRLENKSRA